MGVRGASPPASLLAAGGQDHLKSHTDDRTNPGPRTAVCCRAPRDPQGRGMSHKQRLHCLSTERRGQSPRHCSQAVTQPHLRADTRTSRTSPGSRSWWAAPRPEAQDTSERVHSCPREGQGDLGSKGSVASRPPEARTRRFPGNQGQRPLWVSAHSVAPTWTGASGEVSLHRPQLLPVLQLVDQLRSGDRTPWAWRKEEDTGASVKTGKTAQSRVGLQAVDLRMKLLPYTEIQTCDLESKVRSSTAGTQTSDSSESCVDSSCSL